MMKIYAIRESDSYGSKTICYFKSFKNAAEYIQLLTNMERAYRSDPNNYFNDQWIYAESFFDEKLRRRRPMTEKDFLKSLKEGYHWFLKEKPSTSLSIQVLTTED